MNREPVKRGDVKIEPWPEKKTRSADDTLVAFDNLACCRF